MTKATAKATAKTNNTEGSSGTLSWIPSSSPVGESKKQDNNVTIDLVLKHISTKVDKFGRNVVYFSCSNPEALNKLKDSIDTQSLDINHLSLPFWTGEENDVMIRCGKQNCGLSDEQLQESALTPLKVPCTFKYYASSGKKNGYSVHI